MFLRIGITVSTPYSVFSRPICGPSMKPRSTISIFSTPRPTAPRNVSSSSHNAGPSA